MSRRGTRVPARDKAVLVPTPDPAAAPVVPAGVLPAGVPAAPAVSSDTPLPADQATAPKVPLTEGAAVASAIGAAVDDGVVTGISPVVPEHAPAEALVPPADPAPATGGDVVMERVPGTVPLPSDLVTPRAPTFALAMGDAGFVASFQAELGALPVEERLRLRDALFGAPEPGTVGEDDVLAGVRLFPVRYEVDHDGRVYRPGGELLALTFAEYQRLFRATAIGIDWFAGEVPRP